MLWSLWWRTPTTGKIPWSGRSSCPESLLKPCSDPSELLYSQNFLHPAASSPQLSFRPVAANPPATYALHFRHRSLRAEDFSCIANTAVYRFFPSCPSAHVAAKRRRSSYSSWPAFPRFFWLFFATPWSLGCSCRGLLLATTRYSISALGSGFPIILPSTGGLPSP